MLLHHHVLSMEISSAKRKRERERDFCVCIMMEASQSREEEPLAPDVSSPIYACWKQ